MIPTRLLPLLRRREEGVAGTGVVVVIPDRICVHSMSALKPSVNIAARKPSVTIARREC